MHTTRLILQAAAAAALAAGTAQAAGDAQSRDVPSFNQMDKNNDGALTRSEAERNSRLLAHFDQVDDDRDGRLSRSEYLGIMARQDLHTLRDSLAEFIDPQGKPPLATGQQAGRGEQASAQQRKSVQAPPAAASARLVRNVQDQLHAKGIDAGPTDGIWGPRTHQALREFQDAQRLEATGQLNAPTLAALGITGEQAASAAESAAAGASGKSDAAQGGR